MAANLIDADKGQFCNASVRLSEDVCPSLVEHILFGDVCQRSDICPPADNRTTSIASDGCLIFQACDGKHIPGTFLATHDSNSLMAF